MGVDEGHHQLASGRIGDPHHVGVAHVPVSEEALKGYVKERAASFKTPHHILFRREEQLPRLATGKVAKHRLAEEARRELGL